MKTKGSSDDGRATMASRDLIRRTGLGDKAARREACRKEASASHLSCRKRKPAPEDPREKETPPMLLVARQAHLSHPGRDRLLRRERLSLSEPGINKACWKASAPCSACCEASAPHLACREASVMRRKKLACIGEASAPLTWSSGPKVASSLPYRLRS